MTQSQDSTSPAAATLDALTGLRFFAALGVFVYHAATHLYETSDLWAISGCSVSFFFVLSGFILTYVYRERLYQVGVWQFYCTRWARLWPLHAFLLLAVVGFRYATEYADDPWFGPKFLANALLIQSWLPFESWATSFNGVAWSISTEFGFYLVFPALILIGKRGFLAAYALIWVLTILGLGYLNGFVSSNPRWVYSTVYFHPSLRLLEFSSGMLLGQIFLAGWHRSLARLPRFIHFAFECLAIAVLILVFQSNLNPGYFSKTPGALIDFCFQRGWLAHGAWLAKGAGIMPGALAMIWVFAWSRGPISQLVSSRMLVYLGEISFSLYMVHYIVLNQMIHWAGSSAVLYCVSSLLVSLGVSSILYRGIELPCRDGILAYRKTGITGLGKTARSALAKFFKNGHAVAAGLAMVSGFGLLALDQSTTWPVTPNRSSGGESQRVFAVPNSGIVFQNEARLLYCQVQFEETSGLRLNLVWEVLPGATRYRFIHLSGSDDKVLRQGKAENSKFREAIPGTIVVEEVEVPSSLLKDATKVSIGFFSRDDGAAFVEAGPRSMDNYRLDVFDLRNQKPFDLSQHLGQ